MVLGVGLAALGSKLLPLASQNQAQPAAKKEALTPAQTVTATTVTATTVDRTLKATGTVTAYESIPVLSQATGFQIQQVLVDEGDRVVAGQVLASLDSSAQQAELLQARANVAQVEARLAELKAGNRSEEVARARELVIRIEAEESMAQSDWDLAKTRVKRNQSLAAEGAIARDRLDEVLNEERAKQSMVQQAQARLREARQQLRELEAGARPEAIAQARAQLAQAKAQVLGVETRLRDTTVVAPASGKVAERFARVGDITSGSQKLFSIIENDRLELQLKIPETQLPRLRVGQTATITSDIDPSLRLTARIRELKPLVDANSRQAIAVLDLPDRPNLKPGMFLRAAVVVERVPRLTVPMEAAIPKTNRQAIAYVLQPDRTVRAQTVTLGEILPDNRVEVLSGLAPGDRVAVKGAAYLSDGDRVSVAPLE
jgi:multidrug efflux pump subunit AcrA (membrane-fusion protein)